MKSHLRALSLNTFQFNHLVLHKYSSGCWWYNINLMQHYVKGGAVMLLVQQRQFFPCSVSYPRQMVVFQAWLIL